MESGEVVAYHPAKINRELDCPKGKEGRCASRVLDPGDDSTGGSVEDQSKIEVNGHPQKASSEAFAASIAEISDRQAIQDDLRESPH